MSNLGTNTRLVDGAAIIHPGAYLNQLGGEVIEDRCSQLIGEGIRRIVINFEETELINSIGISILLGIIETVNEADGMLVLSNLNSSSRELFEMLGLLSHIRVAGTEEEALGLLCDPVETVA